MSRPTRLSLGIVAFAFAGAAMAQYPDSPRNSDPASAPPTGATDGTPTFRSYDADHDGRITREEASTDVSLVGDFERLDRNNDQELESAEFARFEAESAPPNAGGLPNVPEEPIRPFPDQRMPPPAE